MPKEKSVGAVVTTMIRKEMHYLLLRYPSSIQAKREYWDLPKGHVEKGETEEQTMKREVREETGINNIEVVNNFREPISYYFKAKGKTVFKVLVFYLAKARGRVVRVSHEHIGYVWVPYREAINHLKFQNAKKVIQKANNFLSKKGI